MDALIHVIVIFNNVKIIINNIITYSYSVVIYLVELKMTGHRSINTGITLQLKAIINSLKSN